MSPVYPFDDAATARAVIDGDGTLIEWNEGARLLLGHPAADVVGRPAARLLARHSSRPAPVGRRWHGTVALRHRDGRTVSVWLLAHHRPPRGGRPGDWLVVAPLPAPPRAIPSAPWPPPRWTSPPVPSRSTTTGCGCAG